MSKLFNFYDKFLLTWISRNDSQKSLTRQSGSYWDFKGVYDGEDNVTYFYIIDELPSEVEVSYHSLLRSACKDSVRINFITTLNKHNIMWKSVVIKNKLRAWKAVDKENENIDEYDMYNHLSVLDKNYWVKKSILYFSIAQKRRKRKILKTKTLMLVSGVRGEAFDTSIIELQKLADTNDIRITRVLYDIPQYLELFSPFKVPIESKLSKKIGGNVVTDEIAARFSSFSSGVLGLYGLYVGNEIDSGLPVLMPIRSKETKAESWLITGDTGSGKSNILKMILGQLLMNRGVIGTINDIEGEEYIPWAEIVAESESVLVTNMAEGTGVYVDPVEIRFIGDKKLDASMFSLSRNFTLAILKAQVGRDAVTDNPWISSLLSKAVSDTYESRGVYSLKKSTWKKSEGLTLFSVYETLKRLKCRNEEQKLALDLCIETLGVYYEKSGARRDLMVNPVNIAEVANAKLVVNSFGLSEKDELSIDPIQLALMQIYASFISYIRSATAYANGMYNFKVWEEYQRWGDFEGSDKTLGVALTGGRKIGDINFIVTNVPKKLLDNDRMGIIDNISTYFIGAIPDEDVRNRLCKRLSITEFKEDLDKIAKDNTNSDGYIEGDERIESKYEHAFLVGLDKTKNTVLRGELPLWVAKSELFRTGVKLKKEVN